MERWRLADMVVNPRNAYFIRTRLFGDEPLPLHFAAV